MALSPDDDHGVARRARETTRFEPARLKKSVADPICAHDTTKRFTD
jgi:hypothetical protein